MIGSNHATQTHLLRRQDSCKNTQILRNLYYFHFIPAAFFKKKTFFTHELAYAVSVTGNDTVLQRLSTAAIVLILTSLPTSPLAFFFILVSLLLEIAS